MKAPRPAPKIGILGPPTQSSSSGLFLLLYLPSGLPWPGNRRVRWGAQSVTFGDCRSLFGHEILFCDYLENMFLPSLFIFLLSGCGIRVKMFIRKGDGKHSSLPLPHDDLFPESYSGQSRGIAILASLRCYSADLGASVWNQIRSHFGSQGMTTVFLVPTPKAENLLEKRFSCCFLTSHCSIVSRRPLTPSSQLPCAATQVDLALGTNWMDEEERIVAE